MLFNSTGNFTSFQLSLSTSALNRLVILCLFFYFYRKGYQHNFGNIYYPYSERLLILYFSGIGIYEQPLIEVYLSILTFNSNRCDSIKPLLLQVNVSIFSIIRKF